jgi:hypothetical protein
MKRPVASPSYWLTVARILLLGWILFNLFSITRSLPNFFHNFQSLKPGSVMGDAFYGWNSEQIQRIVNQLGDFLKPVAIARFLASLVSLLCFWVVGGLLFWRKSDTWIGLLAAFILFSTGPGLSGLQLSRVQGSPTAETLGQINGILIWPMFFIFLYLFPNGKFVPRFTRYLAVLPYLLFIAGTLIPDNSPVSWIATAVLLAYALGGLISQIYRHRKISTPEERQQTKWVVFALGIFLATLLLSTLIPPLLPESSFGTLTRFWFEFVNAFSGALLVALIPLSIGVAILRFRLWDVDVVIRKTLVYGGLTASLALVFFGGVALLQQVIGRLTGAEKSPIAIVLSTLAITALFTPLRHGIQNAIDLRFYRKKYDAQKILERFANSVRNEVELEQLTDHLLAVVHETMQPKDAVLWLPKWQK